MLQKSNDFETLCPASDSDASTRSPDLVHIATMPPQILPPTRTYLGVLSVGMMCAWQNMLVNVRVCWCFVFVPCVGGRGAIGG